MPPSGSSISAAALLAIALAAPAVARATSPAPGSILAGEALPHLELRVHEGGAPTLSLASADGGAPVPPPCVADVCQVRVEVPGFATSFGRPSKTELATVLLGRSRLEPFASIAAVLLATGLRLDWSPPAAAAGDPGAGARWGRVFVRLKLRMDPMNRPVVPDARRARARARVSAPHA